jgi:hypothetical protein
MPSIVPPADDERVSDGNADDARCAHRRIAPNERPAHSRRMGIRLPWDTMSPQLLAFAAVFGIVCGITWLVLRQGLQATLDETMDMTRGVVSWATGHVVAAKTGGAQPWFCDTCHSQNLPTASRCYHGCGPRKEHEDAVVPTAEAPAATRSGTARRRY